MSNVGKKCLKYSAPKGRPTYDRTIKVVSATLYEDQLETWQKLKCSVWLKEVLDDKINNIDYKALYFNQVQTNELLMEANALLRKDL
jgi:hypothetical protein